MNEPSLLRRYLSETSPGSFILNAMTPSYRAASKIYGMPPPPQPLTTTPLTITIPTPGRGKLRAQRSIIESRISDGVLFPSAAIALQTRMEGLLEQRRAVLAGVVTELYWSVKRDIGFVVSVAPGGEGREEGGGGGGGGDGDGDVLNVAGREVLEEVFGRLGVLEERAERVRRAVQ